MQGCVCEANCCDEPLSPAHVPLNLCQTLGGTGDGDTWLIVCVSVGVSWVHLSDSVLGLKPGGCVVTDYRIFWIWNREPEKETSSFLRRRHRCLSVWAHIPAIAGGHGSNNLLAILLLLFQFHCFCQRKKLFLDPRIIWLVDSSSNCNVKQSICPKHWHHELE